jgi:hypothetical protein
VVVDIVCSKKIGFGGVGWLWHDEYLKIFFK